MNKLIVILFLSLSTFLKAEPTVIVELPGLLGNRLFAYCMGKIIAENFGYQVNCGPIWGFPETYSCINNLPPLSLPLQRIETHHDVDLIHLFADRTQRNIQIQGYFQRYHYLKPYADKIRNEWLKIDPDLLLPRNHNDIVVHVRAQYPGCYYIPFQYYKDAIELANFDKMYICTDNPQDPYLDEFKQYNPIIVSTRNLREDMKTELSWEEISKINLDDFMFILSFDKIISSFSTYSWWATFLSEAKEIYAPYPTNIPYKYGKVEEDRYHYIETTIGHVN